MLKPSIELALISIKNKFRFANHKHVATCNDYKLTIIHISMSQTIYHMFFYMFYIPINNRLFIILSNQCTHFKS